MSSRDALVCWLIERTFKVMTLIGYPEALLFYTSVYTVLTLFRVDSFSWAERSLIGVLSSGMVKADWEYPSGTAVGNSLIICVTFV